MTQNNNFYIITGGPGAGKTSLIEELEKRGYPCVKEVAREIIRTQMEINGEALPWKDCKAYSELMLAYSLKTYKKTIGIKNICFFDRGIPDTLAYEYLMNFDYNDKLIKAVKEYRYNKTVFLLLPWKKIYKTDTERKQDYKEAVDTFHIMCHTYKQSGYNIVKLPFSTIKTRADFILRYISNL